MLKQNFIEAINSYRNDSLAKPFFVAVDDVQSYSTLRDILSLRKAARKSA